jgi:hypothetical protein
MGLRLPSADNAGSSGKTFGDFTQNRRNVMAYTTPELLELGSATNIVLSELSGVGNSCLEDNVINYSRLEEIW